MGEVRTVEVSDTAIGVHWHSHFRKTEVQFY